MILAVGPSVVALGALFFALWQQLPGCWPWREMHDLADVRALLDAATAALMDAISGAPDYIRGAMLGEDDAAEQEIAGWDGFGVAVTMHTRMQLRLGRDHSACRQYDAVLVPSRDSDRCPGAAVGRLPARPDRPSWKRGAETASNAYGAFVDAASEVAKVKLP